MCDRGVFLSPVFRLYFSRVVELKHCAKAFEAEIGFEKRFLGNDIHAGVLGFKTKQKSCKGGKVQTGYKGQENNFIMNLGGYRKPV